MQTSEHQIVDSKNRQFGDGSVLNGAKPEHVTNHEGFLTDFMRIPTIGRDT